MLKEVDRYRQLIDLSPAAMLIIGDGNAIVFANDSAAGVFAAATVERLLGRDLLELCHPAGRDAFAECRRGAGRANRAPHPGPAEWRFDGKFFRLDGSDFHGELRGREIDWEGKPAVLLSIQDASGGRWAEAELKRSNHLLSEAERIAKIGHWKWDDSGQRMISCSEQAAAIFGFSQAEFLARSNSHQGFLELVFPDDRPAVDDAVQAFYRKFLDNPESAEPLNLEYRIVRADGEVRHVRERADQVVDEQGRISRSVGTIHDVTEQALAREQARRANELLDRGINSLRETFVMWDSESRFVFCNDRFREVNAVTSELLRPGTPFEALLRAGVERGCYPDAAGREEAWLAERSDRHRNPGGLFEVRRANDLWLLVDEQRMPDGGIVSIAADLSEQKSAEDKLWRSERQVRLIADAMPALIAYVDSDRRFRFVNETAERWYAQPAAEMIGRTVAEATGEATVAVAGPHYEAALAGQAQSFESLLDYPDGRSRHVAANYIPHFDDGGKVLGFYTLTIDISDRKQAEAALQESEASLRELNEQLEVRVKEGIARNVAERRQYELALQRERDRLMDAIEALSEGFALFDADDRLVICNDEYPKAYRRARADMIGKPFETLVRESIAHQDFVGVPDGEDLEAWIADRVQKHLNPPAQPFERQLAGGRWLSIREKRTKEGGIVGIRADITDLKLAEAKLRDSEGRFRDFAEIGADWFWELDSDLRYTYMSPTVAEIGLAPDDFIGKRREDLMGDPADPDFPHGELAALKARKPYRGLERRAALVPDRWLQLSAKPVFAEDGGFLGFRGTTTDISERKRLEQQIRRSQRLDAVGQLTGGIAHDFNNILSIIMGNLELLQVRLKEDPGLLKFAESALRGTRRGAEITEKLLGFSRQEASSVKLTAVNDFLAQMKELIASSLTASIKVEIRLADDLWPVEIDPGELEDAILNLSLNARDAMPGGGTLVFETANKVLDEAYVRRNPTARAGDFVLVSVTDSGTGMAKTVREKLFEPFFTTKAFGQGSGLGLSMVYGFVERSGGHIKVYSEPGAGASFRLYLPRATAPALTSKPGQARPSELPRGSETVLVVDDEEALLDVAVVCLEDLGYKTLTATDGRQAQQILHNHRDIDLMFCDVVMPGSLDGYQLAAAVHQSYPALKVLMTSGFTEKSEEGGSDKGDYLNGLARGLLAKPYRSEDLAFAVRRALDGGG